LRVAAREGRRAASYRDRAYQLRLDQQQTEARGAQAAGPSPAEASAYSATSHACGTKRTVRVGTTSPKRYSDRIDIPGAQKVYLHPSLQRPLKVG
jgi:hypothetical protein